MTAATVAAPREVVETAIVHLVAWAEVANGLGFASEAPDDAAVDLFKALHPDEPLFLDEHEHDGRMSPLWLAFEERGKAEAESVREELVSTAALNAMSEVIARLEARFEPVERSSREVQGPQPKPRPMRTIKGGKDA